MRRTRAGIRSDAGDRLRIELHREAGRQVVRDEDRPGALLDVHRVVVR